MAVQLNVAGVSSSSISGTLVASDPQGKPLQYSLLNAPLVGQATIDPNTGVFTYTVPGHISRNSDQFTVNVSNGKLSASGTVTVNLGFDPLLPNQWSIQNTGTTAFATAMPTAGNDMNVASAWALGVTGKNIKVGIVDSGLEVAHEDLAENVDSAHSFNFLIGTNDPTASSTGFDHGTAVAGIVGAVAFNDKGGRGVAYNARLRGYNLIAAGAFSLANMAKSLGSDPISADNDLFNASFGNSVSALPTFSGAYQSISSTSLTLRSGLGAAIVNAAGNDFVNWEGNPTAGLCAAANLYGVSCGDPANDERRGGYTPIIVGALNADGTHASYSNTGSSLWISAPGGEYGIDSSYNASFSSPLAYKPAIVTTNFTGCQNTEYPGAVNALDAKGANPLAPNCQYTATMNGTSSATPNVAGVVAMMLEANPKLSVHDIKYILAKTAKRVDPTFTGISSSSIISGANVVLEQAWTTNAAGYTFSNRYGFGGVDAGAAVTMARSYTTYRPALQSSKNYPFQAAAPAVVPAASAGGVYVPFTVNEAFSKVDYVIAFVNIATTPNLNCNQIVLTSPSGTRSILMHAANGFANASVVNSRFLSNAFYGEPPNGTWKMTFYDFCAAGATSTALSTANPQVLLLTGH